MELANNQSRLEGDNPVIIKNLLQDLLNIGLRWKWFILAMIILGSSIGGFLAWSKRDSYRSTTVILVEQQKITEEYVRSVVGGSVAERVSTITQQVLSRTNLQKVIDEFSLFPEVVRVEGYEPVIKSLREEIKIEIKGQGSYGQVEAFTISFAHHDPMMAMKVTAKLASQYIEENLKIREQFIEGATDFLEQELQEAKRTLDEKEKALSEFKLKYVGELPGQLDANLRSLDRLQEERNRLTETINGINVRLQLLRKSMKEYESIAAPLAEMAQINPEEIGPVQGSDPVRSQLRKMEEELSSLRLEYTDAYPDVVSLKHRIESLKENLRNRKEGSEAEENPLTEEPVKSIEVPAFDPYINDLKTSENELVAQLSSLNAQLNTVSSQMKEFEQRIERTPTREQELLVLERDYANIQEHYQKLYENKINSRISENLEKRQKGERFRILDPANLPTKPEGLPRHLIALGGFLVGFVFGYGIAFFVEFLYPTFRRSEDAEVSLGLPTLATIPSYQMAFGHSMKTLIGTTNPAKDNGVIANGESNDARGYFEIEGAGETFYNTKRTKKNVFPPQLNLVAKWRPHSIVAEQYRVAATRLDLLCERSMGNVILITSAMKGEGKTSTAGNIAYTLARDLNESTLIIDCDYKCPNMHNVMVINSGPGVADYLAGETSLEGCLQRIEGIPLWCMSVGNLRANPVTLSKMQYLTSMLETIKSRFRFIILDGPPILPLADINVLSGMADVLILAVRSGVTPKDVVQKAAEMIQAKGSVRLIMTDAWTQGVPYYVRHGYAIPYSLSAQK